MSNAAVFLGSASVHTATAGGLGGDGSIGDPLEVLVDGTTIHVNGSNELEVVGEAGGLSNLIDLGTVTVQQVINNAYQPVLLYTPPAGAYIISLFCVGTPTYTDSLYLGVVSDPAVSAFAYADPASLVTWGLFMSSSTISNDTVTPLGAAPNHLNPNAIYVALTNGQTLLRNWTPSTAAPFGFAVRGSDGHQWDNFQDDGGVGQLTYSSPPNFAQGHGGYVADAPNAYQYAHVYALNDQIIGNDIHIWKATTGGTSSGAGNQPDFFALEGSGPVPDGPDTLIWEDQGASPTPYVRWFDSGVVPTVGSMHVVALVGLAVVP